MNYYLSAAGMDGLLPSSCESPRRTPAEIARELLLALGMSPAEIVLQLKARPADASWSLSAVGMGLGTATWLLTQEDFYQSALEAGDAADTALAWLEKWGQFTWKHFILDAGDIHAALQDCLATEFFIPHHTFELLTKVVDGLSCDLDQLANFFSSTDFLESLLDFSDAAFSLGLTVLVNRFADKALDDARKDMNSNLRQQCRAWDAKLKELRHLKKFLENKLPAPLVALQLLKVDRRHWEF